LEKLLQSRPLCIDNTSVSEPQTSNMVLMVRPACFGFHAEAAKSNAFALPPVDRDIAARAVREFDGVAEQLERVGVALCVLPDTPDQTRPDAVFPNNWVSFHADGTVVLYPMATDARRLEREPERLMRLLEDAGCRVERVVDLTANERGGRFLEGTGSLILDRPRRRAFASLGSRTDPEVIAQFDRALGYSTMIFDARDRSGRPIYHTNVLMSLGGRFAVLCVEAVAPADRAALIAEVEGSERTLIDVDFEQLGCFACNLIELGGRDGPVIALSAAALRSFRPDQRRAVESFGELVVADIPTIEAVGGGSVRCMIADVHLPRANPSP
jgi:hypothetical protein